MEKYAVVMAGGTGSRLWPLSREAKPKQFLCVETEKCMLIQTIERLSTIVPPEKCFIITNDKLLAITQRTVKGIIPLANIITEPARKNTAACIAYASLLIREKFGPGVICFVPADGYVQNKDDYKAALKLAFQTAEETKELVVIGIEPTYPATGYGYIHIGKRTAGPVFLVQKFIEKPNLAKAKELLASQEFLWNSGILHGDIDTIIGHVEKFLPEHFEQFSQAVKHADKQDFIPMLKKAYDKIPDISFDTGVLERCSRIHAVKGTFAWDDVGNLDALAKTFPEDAEGNFIKGSHLGIDTKNSVIYSEGIPITTIGVDNMIIAASKDTILVCPRDRVQDIKTLVTLLKSSAYSHLT